MRVTLGLKELTSTAPGSQFPDFDSRWRPMKTVFDDDELKVVNGRTRVLKYSLGTHLNSCYNSNITIIMYLVLGSSLNKKFAQTYI